jgi:6,7-dimethyl-8-ribityllumazine synthase
MAEIGNSNLLNIDTGILPKDACMVIVRTEWNAGVVDKLEQGCKRTLEKYGYKKIKTIMAPGAFEIPFTIKSYWEATKYWELRPHVFIALGCVLRGDTPHFDYVCKAVTDGVVQLNLQLPIPVIFGVLTVDNQQQADERVGGKHGHKGEEAAITALKMMGLQESFRRKPERN